VLYMKVNVLSLPCRRSETSGRGAKQWQVTYFTVKIWYNFIPPLNYCKMTDISFAVRHERRVPTY